MIHRTLFLLSFTGFFLSALSGCVHYTPLAVSTTSFGPEHETYLGQVDGKSSNSYVIGIILDPVQGMEEAIEDAKRKVGADNLINVTVDQQATYYPFDWLPIYVKVETLVNGIAVRYKNPELRNLKHAARKLDDSRVDTSSGTTHAPQTSPEAL